MSLARAAFLARPRVAPTLIAQRRPASTSSHHEEHHGEHDSTQYPREGFSGPIWRNTVLLSLLAVGCYKYAPEPSEDVYLTRWIAMYTAPRDLWLELNAKHTAMQQEVSDTTILLSDAKKPRVHRYRYPQSFEQVSPFLAPVGMDVDLSGLVVKGDRDM
ncbi:hypothetical protein BD779DRAFT_1512339 [Infundibulicybe gibba]|nr:hypothetical protein BD779DRAFT_1512339 [Infundibulicybe gibba]